jgi:hypothetical protein
MVTRRKCASQTVNLLSRVRFAIATPKQFTAGGTGNTTRSERVDSSFDPRAVIPAV